MYGSANQQSGSICMLLNPLKSEFLPNAVLFGSVSEALGYGAVRFVTNLHSVLQVFINTSFQPLLGVHVDLNPRYGFGLRYLSSDTNR